MTGFRADLGALDDLIGHLRAFDRHAADLADDLESHTRRLHGQWSGPAADAHAAAHRRWLAGHEQMASGLGQLTALVRAAHVNYTAASSANVRMWS